MLIFKNTPQSFKNVRNQALMHMIPSYLLIYCMALAILYFPCKLSDWPILFAITALLLLLFLILGFRIFFRGKYRSFDSFSLIFNDLIITKTQQGERDVFMSYQEVGEVISFDDGGLLLRSKDHYKSIEISKYVERRDELIELLKQICPTVSKKRFFFVKHVNELFSILLCLGLYVYVFDPKIIVGIIAIIYAFGIILLFMNVIRKKAIEHSVLISGWMSFFIAIAIVVRIIPELIEKFSLF